MIHPAVFQDLVAANLTLDAIGCLDPSPEELEEANALVRDALDRGLTPGEVRKSLEGLSDEVLDEALYEALEECGEFQQEWHLEAKPMIRDVLNQGLAPGDIRNSLKGLGGEFPEECDEPQQEWYFYA